MSPNHSHAQCSNASLVTLPAFVDAPIPSWIQLPSTSLWTLLNHRQTLSQQNFSENAIHVLQRHVECNVSASLDYAVIGRVTMSSGWARTLHILHGTLVPKKYARWRTLLELVVPQLVLSNGETAPSSSLDILSDCTEPAFYSKCPRAYETSHA